MAYQRNKFVYILITDDCLELESEMEVEENNTINFSTADPESLRNKWEFMGLDDHLKASTFSGLIDKFSGASNYLNDKTSSTQISRVLVLRAVTVTQRLNLLSPVDFEHVITKAAKSTHVVVGATYGLEAYCVFSQDFANSNGGREEAEESFVGLVSKLNEVLNEKHEWAVFNGQLSSTEKQTLTRIKCRLYADLQTQAVRECTVSDVYKHCMKLIEHHQKNIEGKEFQPVPISISLCPLKRIVGRVKEAAKLLWYRDVDSGLVSRCCRIWSELERISSEATALRGTINRNSRASLRQFVEAIGKFQSLLKKDLKIAVVKARESEDDDEELANIIDIAEKHSLFKPWRLDRWMEYKKSESEMSDKMNKTKAITILSSKREVDNELSASFDQKYTLVMWVPPLDLNTNKILEAMTNYVGNYAQVVAGSKDDQIHETNRFMTKPWHIEPRKRIQVEDKIRKFSDYVVKNKSVDQQVQFFVAFDDTSDKKSGCRYSVYEAENVLKDNFDKLPMAPTNLRIQPTPTEKTRGAKKLSLICVLWDYEDLGYPTHFLVEYRITTDCSNNPWKQQKTSKLGESQLTITIPAGEVVEVRVAADTCIGRSEFSDTAHTESFEIVDSENSQNEDSRSQSSEQRKYAPHQRRTSNPQMESPISDAAQGYTSGTSLDYRQSEKLKRESSLTPTSPDRSMSYTSQQGTAMKSPTEVKNDDRPVPKPRKPPMTPLVKTASQFQGEKIRFAETIISHCKKIGFRNGMDLYSIPLKKSSGIESVAKRVYFGGPESKMLRKTILVMGATGSGKTTLINAMINYIFDVQRTDNFRFQLIQEEEVDQSQAHSQTNTITAYDIYHQEGFRVPYSLTIVDTPGYGDTKGLGRDQEITEMIRSFFEDKNGIQELDVVGFVASASTPRLSPTQMYIFESILSIFGKDVKDNIDFC